MPKEQQGVDEVVKNLGILSANGFSVSGLIEKLTGHKLTIQQWLTFWLAKGLGVLRHNHQICSISILNSMAMIPAWGVFHIFALANAPTLCCNFDRNSTESGRKIAYKSLY